MPAKYSIVFHDGDTLTAQEMGRFQQNRSADRFP